MAQPKLHEQENFLPKRQLLPVVGILGAVLLVINIDHNGISTLLPTIAEDLNAQDTIAWAGTSQLVSTTVFSVLYGRLSDIFGRKATFVTALLIFSIFECCCGLATSPILLYTFRALTGASGGGIGNLVIIIASDIVPLRQRGQYMAILGPFMLFGNILSPLLAASFASSTLSWRGFFWLVSPLALIGSLSAAWILPTTRPADSFRINLGKVDWAGSGASAVAIICFMAAISGTYRWSSLSGASLWSASAVAFVIFLITEARWARLPIIPLRMFKKRDVSALLGQTFALGWINQANVYFFPLYAQNVRAWSPMRSGLLLIPIIGVQVVVSVLAGRYMSKSGRYGKVIRLGIVALFLGSALEILFDKDTNIVLIILILILIGIGVGAANQPMVVALQAHTKRSDRAVVSSCRNFFRFFGSTCGVAVSAGIFQTSLRMLLPDEYKKYADSAYSLIRLDAATREAIGPAYRASLRNVFIGSAVMSALSCLCLLFWSDEGYESRDDDEDAVPTNKVASETDAIIPSRTDHSYGTIAAGSRSEAGESDGNNRR